MDEIDHLTELERTTLCATLEQLDSGQWSMPSLCAGWSIRDTVAHLLMPYELSIPGLLTRMPAARFRFDAMADRWARRDPRAPAELVAALRDTASGRFRVPGAPPEAPLSHLVIHLQDLYRPLGMTADVHPRSAQIVLDQMTGRRFRASLAPGLLDGLALAATDTGWTHGEGVRVEGTASALITTLAGRADALHELSGAGLSHVRARLAV